MGVGGGGGGFAPRPRAANLMIFRHVYFCRSIYALQQQLGLSLLAVGIEREKQDVSTDESDKFSSFFISIFL